ncbi:MAG: enoyl-CoA hydratase [Spirochaetaceae bacterium]|nr:enoyl-CoA hydratase [Myxococcales bacterium]MCB9722717.1 enoyl-CoA hydratase [Spirochaetaceae bacterium]HPG27175.1 enoyl-CoA hydratase [Myxococcota bacterium]
MGDGTMRETGTPELLCEVRERVATITFNRPEAKNALTMDMKEAIYCLVRALEDDPGVGCLLLTGAGTAFSAGGDTKRMQKEGKPPVMEDRQRQLRWEHELPRMLHRSSKPTIAALPGAAAGAACSIALSCDLRVASEKAFIITSFLRLGLSGDYGGTWFLTQLVGPAKAREIYFTADRVDAATCLELGIFNRVVPAEQLAEEAFGLAARIAAGPPIATRWMKANLNRALEADLETCLRYEADRMVRGALTDDYVEAVAAFAEKRKPEFEGR